MATQSRLRSFLAPNDTGSDVWVIFDGEPRASLKITFERRPRFKKGELLPGEVLASGQPSFFPLYNAKPDYDHDHLLPRMDKTLGHANETEYYMPATEKEGIRVNFEANQPFKIKIGFRQFSNIVIGAAEPKGSIPSEQNYIVVPGQRFLDGYRDNSRNENGEFIPPGGLVQFTGNKPKIPDTEWETGNHMIWSFRFEITPSHLLPPPTGLDLQTDEPSAPIIHSTPDTISSNNLPTIATTTLPQEPKRQNSKTHFLPGVGQVNLHFTVNEHGRISFQQENNLDGRVLPHQNITSLTPWVKTVNSEGSSLLIEVGLDYQTAPTTVQTTLPTINQIALNSVEEIVPTKQDASIQKQRAPTEGQESNSIPQGYQKVMKVQLDSSQTEPDLSKFQLAKDTYPKSIFDTANTFIFHVRTYNPHDFPGLPDDQGRGSDDTVELTEKTTVGFGEGVFTGFPQDSNTTPRPGRQGLRATAPSFGGSFRPDVGQRGRGGGQRGGRQWRGDSGDARNFQGAQELGNRGHGHNQTRNEGAGGENWSGGCQRWGQRGWNQQQDTAVPNQNQHMYDQTPTREQGRGNGLGGGRQQGGQEPGDTKDGGAVKQFEW